LKKIENILADCIEDIKVGRTTEEECLARYSAVRSQLEPLLKLALSIKGTPSFEPSAEFKIRARVRLMEYIHDNQQKKSWNTDIVSVLSKGWRSGWLKTATIVLAIVMAISASGTGTAYASQDSLPGDALYPVKIATENIRRGFTFNDEAQIELELGFASKRLEEIEALSGIRPGEIPSAVKRYEENIASAIEKAEKDGEIGKHLERLEMIAQETSRHLPIIDDINDIVVTAEKESVQLAAEIALGAQVRALRALAADNPVKAMEINYQAMQNRLNRASDALDDGMVSEAENALGQFEEMHRFGQEISQIAKQAGHDTTVIDSLNNQAASKKLEVTGKMHGKIKDEMMPATEDDVPAQPGGHDKSHEGTPGKVPEDDATESDIDSQDTGSPQKGSADSSDKSTGSSDALSGQVEEPVSPQGPSVPPADPGKDKVKK
jgi:hypothetical protein